MIIVSWCVWIPFIVWGWVIHQNNRLDTHMKESWEAGVSRVPCARNARIILVRFRSNSGLEPLKIPNEEFMKGACFVRALRSQWVKTFTLI